MSVNVYADLKQQINLKVDVEYIRYHSSSVAIEQRNDE